MDDGPWHGAGSGVRLPVPEADQDEPAVAVRYQPISDHSGALADAGGMAGRLAATDATPAEGDGAVELVGGVRRGDGAGDFPDSGRVALRRDDYGRPLSRHDARDGGAF